MCRARHWRRWIIWTRMRRKSSGLGKRNKRQAWNLKISAVVCGNRKTVLQRGGSDHHVRNAAGNPLPTKSCLELAGTLCNRRRDSNQFEAGEKRTRRLLLTRAESAINFRDIDCRSGKRLACGDKAREEPAPLVTISECVNQNCRVKKDCWRRAHSGSRFSSRPTSRELASLRRRRTHSAVPISAISG